MRKYFLVFLMIVLSYSVYAQGLHTDNEYITNPEYAFTDAQILKNQGDFDKAIKYYKLYSALTGKDMTRYIAEIENLSTATDYICENAVGQMEGINNFFLRIPKIYDSLNSVHKQRIKRMISNVGDLSKIYIEVDGYIDNHTGTDMENTRQVSKKVDCVKSFLIQNCVSPKSITTNWHKSPFIENDDEAIYVSIMVSEKENINTSEPTNINTSSIDPNKIYNAVEVRAEFPGGDRARLQWLRDNIQWPRDADGRQLHGDVELHFVIERDGSVSNVKVSYSENPALNSAAINVINSMPKWSPALVKNQPVRSPMGITLFF